jgi:hypothetical protein
MDLSLCLPHLQQLMVMVLLTLRLKWKAASLFWFLGSCSLAHFEMSCKWVIGKDGQCGVWVNKHCLIKRQNMPPKGDVVILGLRRT